MRKRGPRESSRSCGSFSSFSGVTVAACRYAAEVTISVKNFFTSQPDSRNSTASQSSNSGFTGRSPCAPKSSAVFTSPVPKSSCQKRFTVTRAISGFSGAMSQRARPRRFFGASAGSAGSALNPAGVTSSPSLSYAPRIKMFAIAGVAFSSWMCVTVERASIAVFS